MQLTTLQTRLVSAFILFPPVICIVYLGGIYFAGLLLIAYAISIYEWVKLSAKTQYSLVLYIFGFVYVTGSFYLFYLLREIPEIGFALTALTYFCIWASDSYAYIFGKLLKGPKLMPAVSPNKTIAGLVGAMFGPIFILMIGKWIMMSLGVTDLQMTYLFILTFGCILGVVAQAGDLMVSSLKRAAKEKDSGNLIPGHGGALDRIDAMLLATPLFYFAAIKYLVM